MSDKQLEVSLLPWQSECWQEAQLFGGGDREDKVRFQVIAAGRRCGKTEYAAYRLLYAALMSKRGVTWYVGPTQGQARDNIWDKLLELGHPVISGSHVNNLQITLINGKKISLKGADRPDTLRGSFLNLLVIDEIADMRPQVWDEILRPSLTDLKAPAVFIGTPKGRNHFYQMYTDALEDDTGESKAYHFTSYDNPMLDREEIDKAKATQSRFAFNQEFMASFDARDSDIFSMDDILYQEKDPGAGDYLIAVDLAGFQETGAKKKQRRDNTVFAVVKVGDFQDEHGPYNWWVKELVIGRWSVSDTAGKLFNLMRKYQPRGIGIEKGIAKQAVHDPLTNMMRRNNHYFRIEELTHGNQNKVNRITWALEGRIENHLVRFNKGDWNDQFLDELLLFPSVQVHDDTIDALAYISQLDDMTFISSFEMDRFEEWADEIDEDLGW